MHDQVAVWTLWDWFKSFSIINISYQWNRLDLSSVINIFASKKPILSHVPASGRQISYPSASISYAFDLCFGENLNVEGAGPRNISLSNSLAYHT